MEAGMSDVLLTSTMLKVGYLALAFFSLMVFVRIIEWAFDVKAKEAWAKMNDDSIAVAIFMGLVVLAGAHLIGLLWS